MYCSSCGVAVAQSLSYCNYCGERLNGAKGDSVSTSPEVKPEMLIAAMVFVFVLGLGAITVLMGVMKAVLHLDLGLVLFFTLLSFLIMLSLEGVIVRLLFRRGRSAEEARNTEPLQGHTTRELDAAQARVLAPPAASVTEHTTRAFEPIYREPESK